jgi:hypothetical protein
MTHGRKLWLVIRGKGSAIVALPIVAVQTPDVSGPHLRVQNMLNITAISSLLRLYHLYSVFAYVQSMIMQCITAGQVMHRIT